MRDWSFKIDEYAVINEKAKQYLPQHVGELIQIFELKTKGINDYTVKLRNGDFVFVKEKELNKISDEVVNIYHAILKGNWKVLHVPSNEEVTIVMIDLLHNQAEITHTDCSMEVVDAKTLKLIDNEVDKVEEVTSKYAYGDSVRILTDDEFHCSIGKVKDITMYKGVFQYKLEVAGQENGLWFREYELELEDKKDDNEGAIMVEKEIPIVEDLLNIFWGSYKNEDDTYTIPKSVLINLINQLYEEVE